MYVLGFATGAPVLLVQGVISLVDHQIRKHRAKKTRMARSAAESDCSPSTPSPRRRRALSLSIRRSKSTISTVSTQLTTQSLPVMDDKRSSARSIPSLETGESAVSSLYFAWPPGEHRNRSDGLSDVDYDPFAHSKLASVLGTGKVDRFAQDDSEPCSMLHHKKSTTAFGHKLASFFNGER